MPIFKYKAINQNRQQFSGLVDAANMDVAADTLQEKGFTVISLKKEVSHKINFNLDFLNRISPKDMVIFSRQFAVLISANVAMVQSLRVLIDQISNPKLKTMVSEIADEVDSGSRLSEALAKRPKIFSHFYISVIKAGETSGKLEESLNYLADEMEKDYDMMSKIKGAMIYPIFVLAGLTTVGIILMVYVVPQLTQMLAETGGQLPLSTRIVMATSDFLIKYWMLLLLIIVGVIAFLKFYTGTKGGKRIFDYVKLRIPIFGKLFQRIYLVRFTRSMATLILGGVAITESLKISGEVVSNEIYKELIEKTIKEVEDGNSISGVFADSKEIPKMVSQMMNIGEKTGKLDVILDRITIFYSREIDNFLANIMTLLEPAIMVVMGVAVGIMVAAIILPMYNLAGSGM